MKPGYWRFMTDKADRDQGICTLQPNGKSRIRNQKINRAAFPFQYVSSSSSKTVAILSYNILTRTTFLRLSKRRQ